MRPGPSRTARLTLLITALALVVVAAPADAGDCTILRILGIPVTIPPPLCDGDPPGGESGGSGTEGIP